MDYNNSQKEVKKVVPSKKKFAQNSTQEKLIQVEVYFKDGSYVKIFNEKIIIDTSVQGEQQVTISTPLGNVEYTFMVE